MPTKHSTLECQRESVGKRHDLTSLQDRAHCCAKCAARTWPINIRAPNFGISSIHLQVLGPFVSVRVDSAVGCWASCSWSLTSHDRKRIRRTPVYSWTHDSLTRPPCHQNIHRQFRNTIASRPISASASYSFFCRQNSSPFYFLIQINFVWIEPSYCETVQSD